MSESEEYMGRSNIWRKTVSIRLNRKILEKARNHGLNISRISEHALISILDYLESQNSESRSNFLTRGSFQKETLRGLVVQRNCQKVVTSPAMRNLTSDFYFLQE